MLQVTIFEEGEPARVLSFDEGPTICFGRAPENAIVLFHNSISRAHGEFTFRDGQWRVVDLGSRAGMIVVRGRTREHLGQGLGDRGAALSGGEDILILGTRLRIDVKSEDEQSSAAPPLVVSKVAETQLVEVPFFEHPGLHESRKLEWLLDLAKDLNGVELLADVLARISQTVFVALEHATQFTVCVPDANGDYPPAFGSLRDGTQLRIADIAVSRSIVERVVENESAMLFQTGDHDFDPSQSMIAREITSSMAVPLLGANGSVGVMVVDNRTLGSSFGEADLDLMIMLANSAAFALERAQLQTQIEVLFEGFVDTAVTAIEARDPTTSGHSRRVARLTVCLGEAVSQHTSGEWENATFGEEALTELAYSALLHDFGKVGIPEWLLAKAGKLYPEQMDAIAARFELIYSVREAELLREMLHQREAQSSEEALAEVVDALSPLRDQLAEWFALIDQISAGDPVDDATAQRIRGFGAQTFLDAEGASRCFLTPYQIASLCTGRGTLTEQQRSEIEQHVNLSFDVVRQIPWPPNLARVPALVHAHHEKLDGSGYPLGLRGAEVPVEARLLTICDMFDAVTAFDRPYRAALSLDAGIEFLRREAGADRLDRNLVELFTAGRVWEMRPSSAALLRLLRMDD